MVLKVVYDVPQRSLLLTFFIICFIIKAPHFGSWLCFLPQVHTYMVTHIRKSFYESMDAIVISAGPDICLRPGLVFG
jgi:hypothetical protein